MEKFVHSDMVCLFMKLGVNWKYNKTIFSEERLFFKKIYGDKIRKSDIVPHEEVVRAKAAYNVALDMIYLKRK